MKVMKMKATKRQLYEVKIKGKTWRILIGNPHKSWGNESRIGRASASALRKSKALGFCCGEKREIYISSASLAKYPFAEVVIHELLHALFPDATEKSITDAAHAIGIVIGMALWRNFVY